MPVFFIDLGVEQEIDERDVRDKIVFMDNGHLALPCHGKLQRGKKIIVAFSPLGLVKLDKERCRRYIMDRNTYSLSFVPFTTEEALQMINIALPQLHEEVVGRVLDVSWCNPRFIQICINGISAVLLAHFFTRYPVLFHIIILKL